MTEWSQDNILVFAATAKKGGGVNAILSLLQDLIAFQDKVGSAVEVQDLGENKQKLEDFQARLSEMYESLLDMAKGGVQTIRQPQVEESEEPILMDSNTIHQLP